MSIWDLNATTTEMARLIALVTAPSGDHNRGCTGQAKNNVPSLPYGVLSPQSGELILASQQYKGHHKIDLWWLIEKSQGDIARIETRRQKWLPLLLHALDGEMALAQGGVVLKAFPIGWEFDPLDYAGNVYEGIVIHYQVDTEENVSLVP